MEGKQFFWGVKPLLKPICQPLVGSARGGIFFFFFSHLIFSSHSQYVIARRDIASHEHNSNITTLRGVYISSFDPSPYRNISLGRITSPTLLYFYLHFSINITHQNKIYILPTQHPSLSIRLPFGSDITHPTIHHPYKFKFKNSNATQSNYLIII